jgi:hypothetical protein
MPTPSSPYQFGGILNGKRQYFHASGLLQNASSGFHFVCLWLSGIMSVFMVYACEIEGLM